MSAHAEVWRAGPSAPGYEASSLGRIRRGDRVIAGSKLRNGYIGFSVRTGGKKRSTTVHALVAEAFHGERQHGMEVNHKNGMKDDNRPENLEWVTHHENMRHSYAVLGNKGRPKTRKPPPQLPDLRRRLIVEDFDTGEVKRTVIDMHATPRIDSYRVVIDGKPQAGRLGWSRILDRVRLAMPRKCSPRWIGE